MSRKIEEQKGAINPSSPPTSKMQTYDERVASTRAENALRRDGQTLSLHIPKTGKK
jgi:hypothetical protein